VSSGRLTIGARWIAAFSAAVVAAFQVSSHADTTAQPPPFAQNWTDTSLVSLNDSWTSVPGVVGFLGDIDTGATPGLDPQTLLGDYSASSVDVIANQINTGITNGGVAEFEITNPTIALQGSGTADAPYLLIHLSTIGYTNINVSYVLRDVDATADNAVQPVAIHYRVGGSGSFINLPAGFVADATTGPNLATLQTPVSLRLPPEADNQALVELRIMTANAAGNDEWVGVDDLAITGSIAGGPTNPTLTSAASPASVVAGNQTLLSVTVSPGTNPASTGLAVSANLTAIGGSATQTFADDGLPPDLTAGDNVFSFLASVAAGTTLGAKTLPVTARDAELRTGSGSISLTVIDPPPPPPPFFTISEIQGSGSLSPYAGERVMTRGIVTAQRFNNGFFLQSPDDDTDDDPATSEGLFVFTSSAPTASVGSMVEVIATVQEFIPSGDPHSPALTELTNPTVTQIAANQPLPTAIALTVADAGPTSSLESLERYEGMRVQIGSLTVTQATLGSVNESNATGGSNGVFGGVITGVPRPFREPGIEITDLVPPGAPAGTPRFDANPERLAVDSNGQVGSPTTFEVAVGDRVTGVAGPLDFAARTYTVLQDGGAAALSVTPSSEPPRAVRPPADNEFTVASLNAQRFFDDVNDPALSEPVLTPAAFTARLNKASLVLRGTLETPDIIGLQEIENLATLQRLAAKINADATASGASNPEYVAYLVEGNDVGGIDVGFLVKAARVSVVDVVQEGRTAQYTNPITGNSETLNDRPPLVLRAQVPRPGGGLFPVTVIVNHLRSLTDIDGEIEGERVRAKRRAQAEFLAHLIQARQAASPDERIISVGDYNAFQFSDGWVDVLGTIQGTPAPPDQVVLASPDLVDPDLANLIETLPADQQYSYVFRGSAQVLDHALVNRALLPFTAWFEYARIDADFPETARSNPATPALRLSDHDPLVAYFTLPAANATVTALAASPSPSAIGQPVTFTASVSSGGTAVTDGTVTFEENGTAIADPVPVDPDGRAHVVVPNLPLGVHTITAAYSGAEDFEASSQSVGHSVFAGIRIGDVAVTEGDGVSVTATFTVSLSTPASGAVMASVEIGDGTAKAGADYVPQPPTVLTFASGATMQTVSVAIVGDRLSEAAETVIARITDVSNAVIEDGEGVATIVDNDSLPGLFVSDVTVVEGNSGARNAVFTIRLARTSGQEVTVDAATAHGTALAGSDYVATGLTLTFPPGTTSRSIAVPVIGDRIAEDNQTFFLDLTNPSGAQLADPRGRATIVNDDVALVAIGNAAGAEPVMGYVELLFTVRLSVPSEQDVRLAYSTVDVTAHGGTDYVGVPLAPPSFLVIPAGSTTGTVVIRVLPDADVEPPQSFLVVLRQADNARITDGVGMGVIH
jgi:uncharacterized protein